MREIVRGSQGIDPVHKEDKIGRLGHLRIEFRFRQFLYQRVWW
nr:hypothetical protein [uncultured Desulfobulbus sp.]